MKTADKNRSPFSRKLIEYRKARGLTQIQLAELSGISRRMIAYYETNIANPPLNNVMDIAKALKVTIGDLVGTNDTNTIMGMFEGIDMRTLRKILMVQKLPKKDRNTLYNMIDAMLERTGIQSK